MAAEPEKVLLVVALAEPVHQHRRLEVVGLHPLRSSAKELEGAPDRPQEGGDALVQHELIVGVAAMAEGHDEEVDLSPLPAIRDAAHLAEVDLRLLARGVAHAAVDLGVDSPEGPHASLDALVGGVEAGLSGQVLVDLHRTQALPSSTSLPREGPSRSETLPWRSPPPPSLPRGIDVDFVVFSPDPRTGKTLVEDLATGGHVS